MTLPCAGSNPASPANEIIGINSLYLRIQAILFDKILFVGSIESNPDVCFIMLKNYSSSNKHSEKVMMFINITHSSDDIKFGIVCVKKDNTYVPVVKKICFNV